ncbi:MAG: DUF1559 domain-containing protein [Planctomycetaceae bacterium]|nr:DUF1559 domain-containing protein [Planctomycetaceae bacterium]
MRNKRGFTLIELLVVIAIIALLLSIVIPAMAKAKDYVKRIICCNNARQLVLAVNNYSQSFNQKIMPLYEVGNSPVPAQLANMSNLGPHNSYRAFHQNHPDGAGGYRAFHLGVLYEQGFMDTPESFYCPAQPNSAAHYVIPYYFKYYVGQGNVSDYFNSSYVGSYQWGTVTPPDQRGGTGLVRTSYNYWTYGEKTLQKIGGYKPLIVDNIQDWRVVPHRKARGMSGTPQGLTVAYADGHVSFCNPEGLFVDNAANFPWNRAGSENADYRTVGQGPGNYIANFNEILRRLQAQ